VPQQCASSYFQAALAEAEADCAGNNKCCKDDETDCKF